MHLSLVNLWHVRRNIRTDHVMRNVSDEAMTIL